MKNIIKLPVLREYTEEDRLTRDEFTLKQNIIKWEWVARGYVKELKTRKTLYDFTEIYEVMGEGLNVYLAVVGNTQPIIVCVDLTVDEMNNLMEGVSNDPTK